MSAIIRENLCTLFNLLNFVIAVLLFAVKAYSNMIFIAIIILNILIGIIQELKAKKLVDELSILNRPSVCVRRENKEKTIGLEEIVKDDLMVLERRKRRGCKGTGQHPVLRKLCYFRESLCESNPCRG